MSFKLEGALKIALQSQASVDFSVKFSPDTVLNILAIKHKRKVVASDANVSDEDYAMPNGIYVASLTFWAKSGTSGTLKIITPTGVRERSGTVAEGNAKATISLEFVL